MILSYVWNIISQGNILQVQTQCNIFSYFKNDLITDEEDQWALRNFQLEIQDGSIL